MASSMMRTLVLVGLVVAALSVAAEASTGDGLDVKVAVKLNLKQCYNNVKVFVGVEASLGKVCLAGVVTALDAVPTHLEVAGKLGVDLWIQGLLTTLKTHVVVDLSAVAVVDGVYQVVLDVVEDKVKKTVAVLCLGVQLELLDLVKLGITLF